MDKSKLDQIWNDVVTEASNRTKGSFKRALWYGNKNRLIGQNKGVRKAIRNAPKKIMLGALDFAGLAPGLSATVGHVADIVMSAGKDLYSAHIKSMRKPKPVSAEEKLRKQVKLSVKDMQSNAIKVIDRNLVKLKDAGKKVGPSIRELMAAAPDMHYQSTLIGGVNKIGMGMSPDAEKRAQKAHDALRKIAETEYYIDKEMGLVKTLKQALSSLEGDLNKMQEATQKTREEVMDYIEVHID